MKRILFTLAAVAALIGYCYHETDWGNNLDPAFLGGDAGYGASSRQMVGVGEKAAYNARDSYQSVYIGNEAGRDTKDTKKCVGIGNGALGDASVLKTVVAIGNYELAGISGITNTTSINAGQIFVSETYDIAMLRTKTTAAPTNSPFCYVGGNTYIGGTGTTYIAGNVVFNGRSVVVDNTTGGGGGSGTAHLAGSGDLADMTVPYSSGQCVIFVAPNGDDYGDGTRLNPYKTIDRALRDAIDYALYETRIGVYAGEYAYPSNLLFKSATQATKLTLVGLEGADKTKMSLAASGITYDMAVGATTNSTLSTELTDKAILSVPEENSKGWAHVYGFTFDGRTRASNSLRRGTYSGIWFQGCKFTGIDATIKRRYRQMCFANAVLMDCIIGEDFEVNLYDYSVGYGGAGRVFFACGIENSIVKNLKKHTDRDFNSTQGYFSSDTEFYNSLIIDTVNTWYTVDYMEVTDYGFYDSAVAFKYNVTSGTPIKDANRISDFQRTIFAVGTQTTKGSTLGLKATALADSYIDTYTNATSITDANIYPQDDALELFGIGYNNGLTRRFKDYLREKNYQGRDGISVIDLKNTGAMAMLAEGGDFNLYQITAVSNNIPVRPVFALFKAEVLAGNETAASSSLADNKYRQTRPDFENFGDNHTLSPIDGDND